MKWLIIGDGPSRNTVNLDMAREFNIATIGTHRCLDSGAQYRFIPTYLIINDHDVWREQYQNIKRMRLRQNIPRLVLLRNLVERYGGAKLSPNHVFDVDYANSGKPNFSETGPLNLYSLNTGALAIQWAYQNGARDIGIIGMDLYYPPSGPTHHFGDGTKRGATDANFGRCLDWFRFVMANKHGDLNIWDVNPDSASPLKQYVPAKNYVEFCEGK